MKLLKSDQEFYEKKSWGSQAIEERMDLPTLKLHRLLRALPKRGKILEVGCGSGRILASVQRQRPGLDLTGVDISAKQIALAKRDTEKISYVVASGEAMRFKDGEFDAVFFLDVVEHVDHPDHLMRECARVLRKGGVFHLFSPAEGQGIYLLASFILRRHIKEKTAGHIQQFTIRQLRDLAEENNLQIERAEYSYHLLGSIMDFTLFALLLNDRFSKLFWGQNKYYKNAETKQSGFAKIMNALLSFANAIAYLESKILGRCRIGATAVHLTLRK